ncbi:membrane protein [Agaricicola taiwanensis]|uniref:Membrane protein n=1 Tax=Agaricicola taiwanensis TaxID=591372 RepID=A0A8J2YM06_9RHOB|nr:flagellar motor protein MotB [Agaricicola taiwanensis]GGE52902.1 membrane protein [Agaricicola taiwanensis]
MARKKKGEGHAGGHGWYVTFADLMALLMAFFVVVAASSKQDVDKMEAAVGSIREAFGMQTKDARAGVIEQDGLPTRSKNKFRDDVNAEETSSSSGPVTDEQFRGFASSNINPNFAMTAASLRQALQSLPDIAEVSRHIVIEETPDGLAIQLMDQDGRSMFSSGSPEPYERIRGFINAIAPVIRNMPNRLKIEGHTSAGNSDRPLRYGPWELSAERANAVRRMLEANGLASERFRSVEGRADSEPMFPDNPFLAANRRITLVLLNEAPPVPVDALQ